MFKEKHKPSPPVLVNSLFFSTSVGTSRACSSGCCEHFAASGRWSPLPCSQMKSRTSSFPVHAVHPCSAAAGPVLRPCKVGWLERERLSLEYPVTVHLLCSENASQTGPHHLPLYPIQFLNRLINTFMAVSGTYQSGFQTQQFGCSQKAREKAEHS